MKTNKSKINKNEINKMVNDADNLIGLDKYDEAMKLINKVLKNDKNNLGAILLKSEIYYLKRDIKKADEYLNKAIEIDPNDEWCCFRKASMELFKYNFIDADIWINRCLSINPNNWDGIMFKANFLHLMGVPEYSIWLDKAFKLDKKRAENFMKNFWIEETMIELFDKAEKTAKKKVKP